MCLVSRCRFASGGHPRQKVTLLIGSLKNPVARALLKLGPRLVSFTSYYAHGRDEYIFLLRRKTMDMNESLRPVSIKPFTCRL